MAAQFVAVISPGPNTVIVLQSAVRNRKLGVLAAAGIWPVGIMWASISLFGLGSMIATVPHLVSIMYFLCGGYLVWVGFQSIRKSYSQKHIYTHVHANHLSAFGVFRAGVITNITNPKSIAYWMSVFAATSASALPRSAQILAVILMPSISFLWYSSLSFMVSSGAARRFLENKHHLFDRVAGVVMMGFGLKLLVTLI